MSAPGRQELEVSQLQYGFLANRSSEALGKIIAGAELSADDSEVLAKAATFLTSIADGAELVSSGTYHGYDSRRSLADFEFAFDPLRTLLTAVNSDKDVADYVRALAKDLSNISVTPKPEQKNLIHARRFFDELRKSVLAVLENPARREEFFEKP